MDANAEQEYCDSVADSITFNARKRNLPDFFKNLLCSWEECIKTKKEQIVIKNLTSSLKSLEVTSEELHFLEAIPLFELFLEKFHVFGNLSKSFAVGQEVTFIVAQLFSTFLLHIKMLEPSLPFHVQLKYSCLIQLTITILEENSHVLLDENLVLLQRSHLLLWYVVGKAKMASDKNPSTSLLNFLEKYAKELKTLLNGKDKVLSFLVFQLLILKEELLIHKESSEVQQNTISILVDHLEQNTHNGAAWDFDLSTLSIENYGTAIYKRLFDFLPMALNTMSSKRLRKICNCFREVIFHGDYLLNSDNVATNNLRSIILFSLQSSHFKEHKSFQEILVSALWELNSLFLVKKRYSNELENTFVDVFSRRGAKEMCSFLNEFLQSNSQQRIKVKEEIFNILQLIDCLPLRHLPPENQVKCIIGLSTLFFLVPESCKSANAIKVAEKISKQLIAIFDGERSVWLFDFVASGPYLREIMNTIERLHEKVQFTDVPDSLKLLLQHLIDLVTKNSKVLAEAKDYFSEENCLKSVIINFFGRICKNDLHSGMLERDYTSLSPKEINDVFDGLCNQMKNWNIADGNILEMKLNIIKEVLDCDSQKKEPAILKQSVINLLLDISNHVRQAEDTTLHLNSIKIPVFNFFTFMVKQKKICLSDDQWMDCLHMCMTVNLANLSSDLPVFINAFDTVWNYIYGLLVYHPLFILKITPVFMVIVTNLLKSLVLAGSQDAFHRSTKDVQDGLLLCSRNMARLLTVITGYKDQFSKLVPFLVGDYADSVQHNTLEPNIKGNLINGINRILSLSNQNSLKMVFLTCNHSCKEIFTKIVKDYNSFQYNGCV